MDDQVEQSHELEDDKQQEKDQGPIEELDDEEDYEEVKRLAEESFKLVGV